MDYYTKKPYIFADGTIHVYCGSAKIASVFPRGTMRQQSLRDAGANACLIAAAPDMLNLLSDVLFALENIGVEPELCERIREVLRQERDEDAQHPVKKGIWDEMGF